MLFSRSLQAMLHSQKSLNTHNPTIVKGLLGRRYSQELQTKVGHQTINYVKVGQGKTNILCLPGALGTIWSDYKPQLTGLDKEKFTIIAWDPPGYGASRPPARLFTKDFYEQDAKVAHQFMKGLGISNYSLLGWSDGGITSLIFAAKYPENVDKLVVWGANSYVDSKDIEAYEKFRDISKWSEKMKSPLIQLYTEEGLQEMWTGWCDIMTEIHNNGGDICKNLLKQIECPTLILHGDKDPLVPEEHPLVLMKEIKNAKLHRYPEGKHNIHLRYPEDFNQVVSNFILS